MTDPISDMLTRIRNAYGVKKEAVVFEKSKIKIAILGILEKSGYIGEFKEEGDLVTVTLKYENGKPVASSIQRVSKPGRRVYVKADEIPSVLSGKGISVISTPEGLMTGEDAKTKKIGGELICEVY